MSYKYPIQTDKYRIIWDNDLRCRNFFKKLLPDLTLKKHTSLGLEIGGEIKAVVIYEYCNKRSVTMHVAGVGLWPRKEFLYYAFDYPFNQLGVNKCIGFVDSANEKALKCDLHIGFEQEAIIKDATDAGDLIVISMTKDKCRWL